MQCATLIYYNDLPCSVHFLREMFYGEHLHTWKPVISTKLFWIRWARILKINFLMFKDMNRITLLFLVCLFFTFIFPQTGNSLWMIFCASRCIEIIHYVWTIKSNSKCHNCSFFSWYTLPQLQSIVKSHEPVTERALLHVSCLSTVRKKNSWRKSKFHRGKSAHISIRIPGFCLSDLSIYNIINKILSLIVNNSQSHLHKHMH